MRRFCILIIAIAFLLSGCAEPPEERMENVRSRIDAIDTTEVCIYLNDICTAAKDSFKVAYEEMEEQESSSFLSKSFDRTERLLAITDSLVRAAEDSIPRLRQYYGKYIESIKVRATTGYDSATALFEDFRTDPANEERQEKLSRTMIDLTMAYGRAKTAYKNENMLKAGTQYEQVIRLSNHVIARMK